MFYVDGVTKFEIVIVPVLGLRDEFDENIFKVLFMTVHVISGHYTLLQDTLARLNPFVSKSTTILPNLLGTEYPKLSTVLYFSCLFEKP